MDDWSADVTRKLEKVKATLREIGADLELQRIKIQNLQKDATPEDLESYLAGFFPDWREAILWAVNNPDQSTASVIERFPEVFGYPPEVARWLKSIE